MTKFISILILFAISKFTAYAQYVSPDSLKIIIATAKEDTVRIDAMNWLGARFSENAENDSARFWTEKAFNLSTKIKYNKGIGIAMISFGGFKGEEGDLSGALDYFQTAIKKFDKENHKALIGLAYNNIGIVYQVQEKYTKSLEYIYKALRLFTESGYETGIAQSHLSIGAHYAENRDNDEASPHFKIAIDLFKKLGEKFSLAYAYYSKGIGELEQENFKLAVDDISLARDMVKGQKNAFWFEPDYFRAIGLMYTNQGDSCKGAKNVILAKEKYQLAEESFLTGLKKTTPDNVYEIALIHNNLGLLYLTANKIQLAKASIVKCIQMADPLKDKRLFENSYYNLARIDSIEGNITSAYYNLKKYMVYHDDLYNEENIRKRERFKVEFEMEKTESQVKILTAENKLKSIIASKQNQQKKIAYAGICLIILGGGYLFYRNNRQKKIQAQHAMANERLRISQELHDEVGATLSGIAMYSHLAKEQIKHAQAAEVDKSLNIMQQSSGDMVNKLNDIVWLLNPSQDSFQKLIQRLEEYAGEMTAIKNMKLQVLVPEHFSTQNLPVESRRNIYLFCKEAINNAVKYSNAGLLELTVKETNNLLEISISDDGKGFDAETIRRGNGLNNMQKRADDLGAVFNMESKTGQGCLVSLKLKITQ